MPTRYQLIVREVIGFLRSLQLLTQVVIALDEITQTIQEVFSQSEHLLLILRLLILHPGDMDHVEDAQQVLFPRDEDLLLKGLPPERRIVGKCQLQRRLEGNEHNHEIHSVAPVLDIFGVVLSCQFIHMLAHALDVILQITLFFLGRLGVDIFLISHK